ncbi:uncharacterized protein [Maniola hyperantus]|uniref:uncharacterized protein isoform X9 n=1 Tax=Aphantopus hyperantus TaxID=2795564 RepID=UPI003748ACBD
MGHQCTVCFSSSRKNKDVSFFVYPRDPEKRHRWLKAVGREDLIVKLNDPNARKHNKICERHFDKDCLKITKCTKHLTENAYPTLKIPSIDDEACTSTLRREVITEINNQNNNYENIAVDIGKKITILSDQTTRSVQVGLTNSRIILKKLVFNQAVGDEQPSTSAGEELQYQASRYSMLSGNDGNQSALEEIIIKEEITDEERYQCRLCLSVGRKMQELGEYAPLYRKLLFENNYQNTTIPSFMYQMLACWECHAELRKVKRFQDKVRRANNAFETSQNQKCENLSNLSTILIGEYKNSQPGGTDQPSSVEDCAQGIKEEAVEVEVEETALPDPLEVSQVKPSDQEFDINLEIQKETNPSVSTEKVAKRTIPEQTPNILKRAKLDQTVPKPGPKRAKLDQSGQKPAQEEESEPKSTPESDADAIFGKVKIEIDELQKILQERRNKESFKSMKFKCDSCVLGFTDHNRLLEHNKNFHDEEVGTCECDICERRFDDEDQLSAHHRNHFVKFVCKLCNFECYTKTGRAIHFKRHKGALQGTSLEDLLKKKLTSNQRASASGSSHKTST